MDIVFDQNEWRPSLSLRANAEESACPEWSGLKARMHAAFQARRAIASERSFQMTIRRGCFDSGAARVLAGHGQALSAVNLNGLGNRNADWDRTTNVVGPSRTGDRG